MKSMPSSYILVLAYSIKGIEPGDNSTSNFAVISVNSLSRIASA